MPVYEFTKDKIVSLPDTTFSEAQLQERRDLQRLLREEINVIAPDTLVIAEEFREWDESRRSIDLLGIDRDGNLVVIELKRADDAHMELQALRYAAMVSTMTFDQAVDTYGRYLRETGKEDTDPSSTLLEFLGWEEPGHDQFAQDVKIVLASPEFSRELTTAVMWLNGRDLDIRCIRLQPYKLDDRMLVDVQQIIPVPEAAEYQIQVRKKTRRERETRTKNARRNDTKSDVTLGGKPHYSQGKGKAILLVFKYLMECGFDPGDVVKRFRDERVGKVPYDVDGEVATQDEFVKLATKKAGDGGPAFDTFRLRFFVKSHELVRKNGKTYAFSNQWGSPEWETAMDALCALDPENISYTPTENE